MMEVDARVQINVPVAQAWHFLVDIDRWWVASNPEDHVSLEALTGETVVKPGMQLRLKERVAGVPCEAVGNVEELIPQHRVTWRSRQAVYRYWGLRLTIEEGVTWSLRPSDGATELSAHVWAIFPRSVFGRLFEWYAKHVLTVERKDYEHALKELRYLKRTLEHTATPSEPIDARA